VLRIDWLRSAEGSRYHGKAMRQLKPEHLFFGGVLLVMLVSLVLQLTGLAPRLGFWVGIGAFGVGWLPALFAIFFIAIPEWWRGETR
jgi:hypothetical protein